MMKKASILVLFVLTAILKLSAQDDIIAFNLDIDAANNNVVDYSLYNNIDFFDTRADYEYDQVRINTDAFANQLNSLMQLSTNSTSKNGTLLLQLRNLDYNLDKDGVSSHIRMSLYAQDSLNYYLVAITDANIGSKDEAKLKESLSRNIGNFVKQNLTRKSTDNTAYSLDDLNSISSIEKATLYVYNTNGLVDGAYYNFASFVNQQPSVTEITSKFKKDELKEVKIPQDGKLKKIAPKELYAVVVGGRAYIATVKKFIPLYFENEDFYFEDDQIKSRMSFAPSFSIGIGSGGYRGGGIGLGVFNQQKKEKVTYMIDHLTGNFIATQKR